MSVERTPDAGVAGITPGMTFRADVLVKQADVKVTGSGKTFVSAIVEDVTGRVDCIHWDPDERCIQAYTQYEAIEIAGKCGTYKDKAQLTVTDVRALGTNEIDWPHLLAASPCNVDWMKERLSEFIQKIKYDRGNRYNEGLGNVVEALTMTPEFLHSPAATFMHHAYLHGLLEHSLSVCTNACRYAGLGEVRSGGWDWVIVVAASLLHDVGKTREYTMTGKRTPAAKQLGHSLMGCEMLEAAAMMESVDHEQIAAVKHVIASHHGRTEWGAVVEPQTAEAWLVHAMDLADSRLFSTSKRVG